VEKYGTVRQVTDDSIIIRHKNMRFACRVTKARIQAHTQYLLVIIFNSSTKYFVYRRLHGAVAWVMVVGRVRPLRAAESKG